jgi:5-methylcytosine-specific restriction endonuclease McrA
MSDGWASVDGEPARRMLEELDSALKVKKSVRASRVRRETKKKTRKEKWAEIREAVLRRSHGLCECGCGDEYERLEVDHFFGGNGRRKALESVETCWALSPNRHWQKTQNLDPETDLREFIAHCNDHAGRNAQTNLPMAHRYAEAAEMARARLEALQLQGRTGEQT